MVLIKEAAFRDGLYRLHTVRGRVGMEAGGREMVSWNRRDSDSDSTFNSWCLWIVFGRYPDMGNRVVGLVDYVGG